MNRLRNEGMERCPAQRPAGRSGLLSLNPPYKILFYPKKKVETRDSYDTRNPRRMHTEYVIEKE